MDEINFDVLMEVLLKLPKKEVDYKCRTNKLYATICDSEYFWKKYLFHYTRIDFVLGNSTYKKTAKIVFEFIQSIFGSQFNSIQYVSIWALRNFMKFINTSFQTIDQIIATLDHMVNYLVNDMDNSNLLAINLFDILILETLNTPNSLIDVYEYKYPSLLVDPQNNFLMTYFFRIMSKPSDFIDVNQNIRTFNYNIDDAYIILSKLIDQTIPNTYDKTLLEDVRIFLDQSTILFQ